MSEPDALILDTHIWIWFVDGHMGLPTRISKLIERVSNNGRILIPIISVWEVSKLEQKGRLGLSRPSSEWVKAALANPGFYLSPLTVDIALDSCSLPGSFHNDPADRFIVATSRIERVPVITRDKRILDYGSKGHVQVLKA